MTLHLPSPPPAWALSPLQCMSSSRSPLLRRLELHLGHRHHQHKRVRNHRRHQHTRRRNHRRHQHKRPRNHLRHQHTRVHLQRRPSSSVSRACARASRSYTTSGALVTADAVNVMHVRLPISFRATGTLVTVTSHNSSSICSPRSRLPMARNVPVRRCPKSRMWSSNHHLMQAAVRKLQRLRALSTFVLAGRCGAAMPRLCRRRLMVPST
jgi:hypothetical protein